MLGDRTLVDFYETEALLRDNRWIREQMLALIAEADRRSLLRTSDINLVSFQSRAMAYGLARMHVDSHLEEFGISAGQAREAMSDALRAFLVGLVRDPEAMRLPARDLS